MSDEKKPEVLPESIRVVRLGHGANCSSIGSVVDTLFASAVLGGAVLAAVLAAMRQEKTTVIVGSGTEHPIDTDEEPDEG